jgi:cyclic-di-AMP phosphodiesterase PgpH
MEAALTRFFERIADSAEEADDAEDLESILSELGISASPEQREILLDPDARSALRDAALTAVRQLLPAGVMTEASGPEITSSGRILVVGPEGGERFVAQDSVMTSARFFEAAAGFLPDESGSEVNELLRLGLIRFMDETLRFDASATQQDRAAARRAVATTKANVLEGEAVIRGNQQLGEQEIERLRAYEEALRARGAIEQGGPRMAALGAAFALNLLILSIFGFLIYFFRLDVYRDFRWLLLLGALVTAFAGAGGIIARNNLPPELLPIAFVALAVAVLWDGRLALVLAATLAALVGVQGPFQAVNAWVPVFVAGSAAALSVRAVRRRAQTWLFIAVIGLGYLAVILTLGAVIGRSPETIATSFAWALGNAVVSGILAMGFLPVFEWFTRITTDQTLLEWADPNRPLLKRLSMEAPGTYAHAINVANIAEAAANAIGANGLLCRVGVYYHDVGKMSKPQYFVENQPPGRNPHDRLKPTTSASIVREHVTEGVRLARDAKLPEVLVDFIPEHHGTQEISFFYQKAIDEAKEGGVEPDPVEFRYPGPRPRSRETAIVMLADSVESATRTLQDPTEDRIRALIDRLVEDKIRQGQLEEAPLTLREMGIIKAQFAKVLGGLYHQRIDYPGTRDLTEKAEVPSQGGEPGPGEPSGTRGEPGHASVETEPEPVATLESGARPRQPAARRRRPSGSDEQAEMPLALPGGEDETPGGSHS